MHTYEALSSTTAYEGERATVRADLVSMPDGTPARREVVVVDDAVAVVALDEHGRVCLLEQYRHPLRRRLLELPAGRMDVAGESPLQTAQRELREETGLASQRWSELSSFENSAGWSTERTHVLLAEQVFAAEKDDGFAAADEESDMRMSMVPFGQALRMVEAREITDAKTIVGVLLAARRLDIG
jgi:ADP-ribose pyrophosphatase